MGGWLDRLTPKFMRKYIQIWREEGWRAALKAAGWKLIVGIILYYLIRDTILYILIPYLIYKEVAH